MLRIRRGEESKLTSWYFEIDRKLLGMILVLMVVGLITLVTAGSADAARSGQPWFHYVQKAFIPYTIGLFALFGFSMLNKNQIIKISICGLIFGLVALVLTYILPAKLNGSLRWLYINGRGLFMPADVIKPFFIVITAWFLSFMRKTYGSDIFLNREAWRFKWLSWWPYLAVFAVAVILMARHPDIGSALLYVGCLAVMAFVAGLPLKWLPYAFDGIVIAGMSAVMFVPHIRDRAAHIFNVEPYSQAYFSINAIRHGGLFGSGDEAYVKDYLPESVNDYVFASIAEDWGAIIACLLIVLLFMILDNLIKHAVSARDEFVVYALSGVAALFGGQIVFNLTAALHLVLNKGTTLPFVSYGGVAFISSCVLFGIALSLMREDAWKI